MRSKSMAVVLTYVTGWFLEHEHPITIASDSAGANPLSLDGQEISGKTIPLLDHRREHFVEMKV